MKETYENLKEYLLDLLKEGHWDGQIYKIKKNECDHESHFISSMSKCEKCK